MSKELFPEARKERYEIYNKLFFDSNVLYRRHNEFLTELVRKSKSGGDITFHKLKIFGAYDIIDTFLKENRYIAGKKPTIADIACFATISTLDLLYPVQNCANRWSFLTIWFNDMRRMPECQKNVVGLQKLQNFLEKLGTEIPKTYECPLGEISFNELSASESRHEKGNHEDVDDSRKNMKDRKNDETKSKARPARKKCCCENTRTKAAAGSREKRSNSRSFGMLSNTNTGKKELSEFEKKNFPCVRKGQEVCDIDKCCCELLRNKKFEMPEETEEDIAEENCCCDITKDKDAMTQFNNSQGNIDFDRRNDNNEMVMAREEINKTTSTVQLIEREGEILSTNMPVSSNTRSKQQIRQTFDSSYYERPVTSSNINADMTMPTDRYRNTIDYRQGAFQTPATTASLASAVPYQSQQYPQMNYPNYNCACEQMSSHPVQYNQPHAIECGCYQCQPQYAYTRRLAGNGQPIETTTESQGRSYNSMYSGKDNYNNPIAEILKKNGWYDDRCSMEAMQRRQTANATLLGRTSKPTSTSCTIGNCKYQTSRGSKFSNNAGSCMDRELQRERMRHDCERQKERKIEEKIEYEIEKRELSRRKEKDRSTQRVRDSDENFADERFIKVEPMYETSVDENLTKIYSQIPQQQSKRTVRHFEETVTVSKTLLDDLPRTREILGTNSNTENKRFYTNNTVYTQMPMQKTVDSYKEDFEEIKTFSSYILKSPRLSPLNTQENDGKRSNGLKKRKKSASKNKTKTHKKKEKSDKRKASKTKKLAATNKIGSKKNLKKNKSLLETTNLETTNSLNTSGTSLQNLNDRMALIRKKVEEQEKHRQCSTWKPNIVGPSQLFRTDTHILENRLENSDVEEHKKRPKTSKIETITAYERNDISKPRYTVTEEYITPESRLTTVHNYAISADDVRPAENTVKKP